jgi:hypothetical protein
MDPQDIASTGPAGLGAALLVIGGVGGWLVGEIVGLGLGFPLGAEAAGAGSAGQAAVIWTVAPFMLLLALGLFTARARPEAFAEQPGAAMR